MKVKYKPVARIDAQYDQLYATGHYEEAIGVMRTFLEECELNENPYGSMLAHISIATCYYCMGQIESAFQSILHYKKLCDEYGDQYEQYNLCHIQALIYEHEQNYAKAKEAIEQCIHLANTLSLPHELCVSYSMLGYIYLMTEQYKEALAAAQDALVIAELHYAKDSRIQCQIYSICALSYAYLGQLPEATQALEVLSYNPFIRSSRLERSRYLYIQGVLAFKKGGFPVAISFLAEAEALASSTENSILLKRVYLLSARAHEQLKQFEMAYHYMSKHTHILEEMYKGSGRSKVSELDAQYNISTIEHRANTDSLSGVYTRYYLESTCDQWLSEARQKKDHICCLVFDVDDFKIINDQYGHLVGDEVIKVLGQTCKKVIREKHALVGRYGGDEFVIIFKNFTHQQLMEKAGELFQALTGLKVSGAGYEIGFTVSMGMVSNTSIIAHKFKQLFRVADQALYMAKNQGKNQIVTLSNTNCNINCSGTIQ